MGVEQSSQLELPISQIDSMEGDISQKADGLITAFGKKELARIPIREDFRYLYNITPPVYGFTHPQTEEECALRLRKNLESGARVLLAEYRTSRRIGYYNWQIEHDSEPLYILDSSLFRGMDRNRISELNDANRDLVPEYLATLQRKLSEPEPRYKAPTQVQSTSRLERVIGRIFLGR